MSPGTSNAFARLTSSSAASAQLVDLHLQALRELRAPLDMRWKNGLPTDWSESLMTAVTLRL